MPERQRMVAVIEDDARMRRGIERVLAAHGFDTRSYASAEEFMECKDQVAPTCIVLDISLGGMSGIELRRRMIAAGSGIPTIFVTALDDPAILREADELGCVACLLKPFPASQFIGAVNQAFAA
jgi:FixJ family two-component response regulator